MYAWGLSGDRIHRDGFGGIDAVHPADDFAGHSNVFYASSSESTVGHSVRGLRAVDTFFIPRPLPTVDAGSPVLASMPYKAGCCLPARRAADWARPLPATNWLAFLVGFCAEGILFEFVGSDELKPHQSDRPLVLNGPCHCLF